MSSFRTTDRRRAAAPVPSAVRTRDARVALDLPLAPVRHCDHPVAQVTSVVPRRAADRLGHRLGDLLAACARVLELDPVGHARDPVDCVFHSAFSLWCFCLCALGAYPRERDHMIPLPFYEWKHIMRKKNTFFTFSISCDKLATIRRFAPREFYANTAIQLGTSRCRALRCRNPRRHAVCAYRRSYPCGSDHCFGLYALLMSGSHP